MLSRRHFLGRLAALVAGVVAAPAVLEASASDPVVGMDLAAGESQTVAALFQVGDVITIEGRYAINPITRCVIPDGGGVPMLQRFVVTQVCSASEIVAAPERTISPRMIYRGEYQNIAGTAPIEASDVRPVPWCSAGVIAPITIDWSKQASFAWEGLSG